MSAFDDIPTSATPGFDDIPASTGGFDDIPGSVPSAFADLPDDNGWARTAEAVPGTLLGGTQEGIGGVTQYLAEHPVTIPPIGPFALPGVQDLVKRVNQAWAGTQPAQDVAEVGAGIAESGRRTVEEADPGNIGFWQRATLSGVVSIGQQLPVLALSVAMKNPTPSIAAAAAIAGGQTYSESRIEGDDPDTASKRAGVDAAAEAVFEIMPMKYLIDNAGGPVLRLLTGTLLREIPTEIMTTAVQDANRQLRDIQLKGKEWNWKQYGQALLETAGSVLISAPLLGGAGIGAHRLIHGKDKELGTITPDNTAQDPTIPPPPAGALVDNMIAQTADLVDTPVTPEIEAAAKDTLNAYERELEQLVNPNGFEEANSQWTVPQEAPSLDASNKTIETRLRYFGTNPNDTVPFERQTVTHGPEGTTGQLLGNLELQPGVYTIGEDSHDRPAPLRQGAHDSVNEWAQTFMPNATIMLINKTNPSAAARGAMTRDSSGRYWILMPELPKIPEKYNEAQAREYNTNAQVTAFYGLGHEFGHALMQERFWETTNPHVAAQILEQSIHGVIPEELIAQASPEIQDVLREFNAKKVRILDGTMLQDEFQTEWMSPSKMGKQNAVVNERRTVTSMRSRLLTQVKRGTPGISDKDAQRLVDKFFGLDEYLAEQTARYAFSNQLDIKSPLGRPGGYLANALDSLRRFFASLKKTGLVAPGVSFQRWMDGIGSINATRVPQEQSKAKPQVDLPTSTVAKTQGEARAPPQRAQHNEETDTLKERQSRARVALTNLLRAGDLTSDTEAFKKMAQAIKEGDFDTFTEEYQVYAEKAMKFSLNEEKIFLEGQFDPIAILESRGFSMYAGELERILVRELVQNSYDAIKAKRKTQTDLEPYIAVEVSPKDRTITVTDNGVGMTPEILQKAFLTYPGSDKTGLAVEERSGGLGEAKQVVVFSPTLIEVDTTRDGVRTRVKATPRQIMKGMLTGQQKADSDIPDIEASKSQVPGTESGTTVILHIPEQIKQGDAMVDVNLDGGYGSQEAASILDEFPVTVWNKDVHGEPRKALNPVKAFDMEQLPTVETDWGYIDIYISPMSDGSYHSHRVYSAGLYQFDTKIKHDQEVLPREIVLNIRSKVDGRNIRYPFESNRQALRAHTIDAVTNATVALFKEDRNAQMLEHIKAFTQVIELPYAPEAVKRVDEAQFKHADFTVDNTDPKSPQISFKIPSTGPQAFYYNGTGETYMAIDGWSTFISKLATVYRDFLKIARAYNPKLVAYHPGIGLERPDWRNPAWIGLHFQTPYKAVFINPLAWTEQLSQSPDPVEAAYLVEHAMRHEVLHNRVSAHDGHFSYEFAKLDSTIGARSELVQIKRRLVALYQEHWNAVLKAKEIYDNAENRPKNERLVGDVLEEALRVSENARDANSYIENEFRTGSSRITVDRVRGSEDEGLSPELRFELEPLDTSLYDIEILRSGIPEESRRDPKVLADAEAQWRKLGFRSPYYKQWAGDWENDPASATKVMRADGQPLVVFHATRNSIATAKKGSQPFFRFQRGDLGFHFGTLRAAHIRGGYLSSGAEFMDTLPEIYDSFREGHREHRDGLFIIPSSLNIRNPLDLGEEIPEWWGDPSSFLYELEGQGVITSFEREVASARTDIIRQGMRGHFYADLLLYALYAPTRKLLVEKGYDGIVYDNTQEGDRSWVALHPNQVKGVLSGRIFSKSEDMSFELEPDLDASKPESIGMRKIWNGLDKMADKSLLTPIKRAMRRVRNLQYHTLQLQQLAHQNPDNEGLNEFDTFRRQYYSYAAKLMATPDAIADVWSRLGKENRAAVEKFLFAEQESGEHWFEIGTSQNASGQVHHFFKPSPVAFQKLKEFGIDPLSADGEAIAAHVLQVKNSLMKHMDETQRVLVSLTVRRYAGASEAAWKAATVPIMKKFQELRKKPFFPHARFGNYIMTIERKKAEGKGWELIYKEAFEDEADWETAVKSARTNAGADLRVTPHRLSDQSYVLMALPLEFINEAQRELDLTNDQVETLMDLLQPVKSDRPLRSFEQAKLGIKGYSRDAMRAFADFSWHHSNVLAKLLYRANFNEAIRMVTREEREAQRDPSPDSIARILKLNQIHRYLNRTRDYMMHPPNELQTARAVVSILYLGLNVKTALMNFYGLITTWSDLITEHGALQGNKLFITAMHQSWKTIKLTNLNIRKPGEYLKPEVQKQLDRALEEGVLTQSYAYHLAGMANASNLYRLPTANRVLRLGRNAVDLMMWTFRLTELGTRRVSFISEYEGARSKGMPQEAAYQLAVQRVDRLQNDYTLGNRVPFMRGIKTVSGNPMLEGVVPLATVFMSFAQHIAWHAYGGYELGMRRQAKAEGRKISIANSYTAKIWVITLFVAGLFGLPMMENLLDILEVWWRKFGDGKTLRQHSRDMIKSQGGDPLFWTRGFGHNVMGFDISRSVGFGRIVPGTDSLQSPHSSAAEVAGDVLLDLAGATGSLIKFGLEAIWSDKPLGQTFKRLPGGIGNIYNAYSWSQEGVRTAQGSEISHDPQTGELRELTAVELIGKAAGFNPTIVSDARAVRFEQWDRELYWTSKRKMLFDDYWRAFWQQDREALKDVRLAIREYNSEVRGTKETRRLMISGKNLSDSLRERRKNKNLDEKKLPRQRKFRRIYEDVRKSYSRD